MTDDYSKQRRVRNEAVFQRHNQQIQRLAKDVVSAAAADLPLLFVCECARAECRESIEIPFDQYTEFTRRPRAFVVKPGHEQTDIERVVIKQHGYFVVEKFADLPMPDSKPGGT